MQRVLRIGVMVALFGALSVPAQAALITTENLAITNGDKLFDNFTCNIVEGGAGGTPSACSEIDVLAVTDEFGNFGIRFQFGGSVIDPNSSVDITIGYDATVLDPAFLITDVHLRFNGAVTPPGGFTQVTEQIIGLIPGGGVVGQAQVQNPPPVFEHTIFLSTPQSSIHVDKDILLRTGSGGTAAISTVDQYLSQTAVPEPGSMFLLGTGLLGLAGAARRRFKLGTN